MAENIEIHIKNLQSKLQLLLKKHALLQKENEYLEKENADINLKLKSLHEKNNQFEMQVNILKTSAGNWKEKKNRTLKKVLIVISEHLINAFPF